MKSRFYGLYLRNNQVLSVQTRGYTIFPGGKPKKLESGKDCLIREFDEELSGTIIEIENHYRDFPSVDCLYDESFLCKNYFVNIIAEIGEPSSEIEKSQWVDSSNIETLKFSDSSKKTLLSLIEDGLVK